MSLLDRLWAWWRRRLAEPSIDELRARQANAERRLERFVYEQRRLERPRRQGQANGP